MTNVIHRYSHVPTKRETDRLADKLTAWASGWIDTNPDVRSETLSTSEGPVTLRYIQGNVDVIFEGETKAHFLVDSEDRFGLDRLSKTTATPALLRAVAAAL